MSLNSKFIFMTVCSDNCRINDSDKQNKLTRFKSAIEMDAQAGKTKTYEDDGVSISVRRVDVYRQGGEFDGQDIFAGVGEGNLFEAASASPCEGARYMVERDKYEEVQNIFGQIFDFYEQPQQPIWFIVSLPQTQIRNLTKLFVLSGGDSQETGELEEQPFLIMVACKTDQGFINNDKREEFEQKIKNVCIDGSVEESDDLTITQMVLYNYRRRTTSIPMRDIVAGIGKGEIFVKNDKGQFVISKDKLAAVNNILAAIFNGFIDDPAQLEWVIACYRVRAVCSDGFKRRRKRRTLGSVVI